MSIPKKDFKEFDFHSTVRYSCLIESGGNYISVMENEESQGADDAMVTKMHDVPSPCTSAERIERAARIKAVKELPAQKVLMGDHTVFTDAKKVVRSFQPIVNDSDGRVATIPVSIVGKMFGYYGFDYSRILKDLPHLYKSSILGWSEPEYIMPGHKRHRNHKAYHHYINKFTDGKDTYYVRFSVTEENVPAWKTGRNFIHAANISDIGVYKKGDGLRHDSINNRGETSPSPYIDRKLQAFFESVTTNKIIYSEEKSK